MPLPARNRIAFAVAASLALGIVWLARSGPLPRPAQTPARDELPMSEPAAMEALEAPSSEGVLAAKRIVASSALASTEDVAYFRELVRSRKQAPQPAWTEALLPCRLHLRVLDAAGQPVTTLQRVSLQWDAPVQGQKLYVDLESEGGEYTCAIADAPGTVEVHSVTQGTASVPYQQPSGGTSRIDLRLGFLALIQGRVIRNGSGVDAAQVALLSEDSARIDPLTRIVAREAVSPCRAVRGQVSTGRDGRFQFALPWRGRFRICAREPQLGACLTEPFEIQETREPIPFELELAPAAHLEVRPAVTNPWWRVRRVSLRGDNGVEALARCDERDGAAAFDCLPAGSYSVLREFQYWTADAGDPPSHIELDGAPETAGRGAWPRMGAINIEVLGADAVRGCTAELYRQGCCATLVARRGPGLEKLILPAGDLGEHLLAVFTTLGDGMHCTLVFPMTLTLGRNELRLPTIGTDGDLTLGTSRFDLAPERVLARFEIGGGGQLFVPFHKGSRWKQQEADAAERSRFLMSTRLPSGTCDLVRERDGQFEVLRAGVRIGSGAPTTLRL